MIVMKNALQISVPPSFRTVEGVLAGLHQLEAAFVAAGDRHGVFTTAYVVTTTKLKDWIDHGHFLQNELVERYVVAFGNAYRDALAADTVEFRGAVPLAWRQSFDACRAGRTSIFQDLLLGINAHINHDLAHAVIRAGLDVNCQRCYQDHCRMNEALRLATPLVRRRVAANYSRWLDLANWIYGRSIDRAVARAFEQARENAWGWAKALAAAGSDAERANVEQMISRRAEMAGQQILDRRRTPGKALALLYEIKGQFSAPTVPRSSYTTAASLCPLSIV
jgi:hypothetical protein